MKREKSWNKRFIPLLVLLAVLVIAAVAIVTPTFARYVRETNGLGNNFNAATSKEPKIVNGELDAKGELADVYVEVGDTDYPVYVRVEILITWQDEDGIVFWKTPVSKTENSADYDYEIEFNEGEGKDWKEIDGYYYHRKPVEKAGNTEAIIASFKPAENLQAPVAGYKLHVEIIAQTVQAVGTTDGETPETAMKNAWGVTPDQLK